MVYILKPYWLIISFEQARKLSPWLSDFFYLYFKDLSTAGGKIQPTFTPNDNLWIAGVKVISDGSPHCGTAAIKDPYLESNLTKILGFPPAPNYGKMNYSDNKLKEMVSFFHQQGTQIAVHAHGERAIDQVIETYDKVRGLSAIEGTLSYKLGLKWSTKNTGLDNVRLHT